MQLNSAFVWQLFAVQPPKCSRQIIVVGSGHFCKIGIGQPFDLIETIGYCISVQKQGVCRQVQLCVTIN